MTTLLVDKVQDFPKRRALARAISAVVAGTVATSVTYAQDGQIDSIEEIVVTARKRTENLQDIPQSVQAFGTADIERYGFKGIEDYARFVPSMTVTGGAPGQTRIIFRGVADSASPYIAQSSSGIYLNEQPITTQSISPEVRPVDVERIEALSGPQGTLYGASSQSGTLRVILNKPDTEGFSASLGVSGNSVDDGGEGYEVEGIANIPIIEDTLAIRLVGFIGRDAGFIDNVLGSNELDRGGVVVPGGGTLTNASAVEEDINHIDWMVARASVLWHVNEDWSVSGMAGFQSSDANGWNQHDPTVGDLDTINFFQEYRDDKWSHFNLTVNGDLGFADVISTTSYFNRRIDYVLDKSSYAAYFNFYSVYNNFAYNAAYAYYNLYDFSSASVNYFGGAGEDQQTIGFNTEEQKDRKFSQEVRLSHEGTRWQWTLGFFYAVSKQEWLFKTTVPGYRNSDAFRAWSFLNPGLAPTDDWWHSGEYNKTTDTSVFGEVTYSITDKIDLIFGGRYYDQEIERDYFVNRPGTRLEANVTPSNSDSGFLPKGGVQYNFDDDRMVYALRSEGFRAGGINRSRGTPALPFAYDSDKLVNYEGGAKTQWMDGRLQINISGYHQIWKNYQLEVTDPSFYFAAPDKQPFQTVVTNVGDAVVDGIDFDITAVPVSGLEVGLSGTWIIKNELDGDFVVDDPRSTGGPVLDLPDGTRLPLVADWNISGSAQYGWPVNLMGGSDAFVRFQFSYTGDSLNSVEPAGEPFAQLTQPSYIIGDMRAGIGNERWTAEVYVNNLWDERAVMYHPTYRAHRFYGRDRITTNRPRNFGLRIKRYFN